MNIPARPMAIAALALFLISCKMTPPAGFLNIEVAATSVYTPIYRSLLIDSQPFPASLQSTKTMVVPVGNKILSAVISDGGARAILCTIKVDEDSATWVRLDFASHPYCTCRVNGPLRKSSEDLSMFTSWLATNYRQCLPEK